MTLVGQAAGDYHFLPGSGVLPFCAGVVADPGYEIIHAVLLRPIPYRQGFQLIERHLAGLGRPRTALCAVELRVRKPYTREEWLAPDGFNARYGALLREWGLFVDGQGSTGRTNIATELSPSAEQVLFAFSYTVPAPHAPPTFVVSGVPEARTVRPGETSPDALREKTADIVANIERRLASLAVGWDQVTQVCAYSVHDLYTMLRSEVLDKIGPTALNGVQWFYGSPPAEGSEIEIDARGFRTELRLAATA